MEHTESGLFRMLESGFKDASGSITPDVPERGKVPTQANTLGGGDTGESKLVRNADAVLQEELQGRESRDNDQMQGVLSAIPMDPESTLNLLLQRETNFADTLMKVLKQRPEQLTQIAAQLANMEQPTKGSEFIPFPLLNVSSPVSPGNVGQIAFSLINDSGSEAANYALHTTDLVGKDGKRIPATFINVSPNASIIQPGETVDGHLEIRVPSGTPPGTYAGLLKTDDINRLIAIVQLAVAKVGGPEVLQVSDEGLTDKLSKTSRVQEPTEATTGYHKMELEKESQPLKPPRFEVEPELLARAIITIESQRIIGPTPDGIRVTWSSTKGRVTGPKLYANLVQGADWMQIRPDGIGNIDVRAILETDDGAKIMTEYQGILEWGEDGYQRFLAKNYPKPLRARTVQRFLTGDSKYSWLNRVQCIGIGEVYLDEKTYIYDAYVLR